MNCQRCNADLLPGARFCPRCGIIITAPTVDKKAAPAPSNPTPKVTDPPTQPGLSWGPTQYSPAQPNPGPPSASYNTIPNQQPMSPLQPPPALQYYQTNQPDMNRGANMSPSTLTSNPDGRPARQRKRRGKGCALGCLTTLLVLLVAIGAGWFLLARPYIHNLAQTKLDQAMTDGIKQIPTSIAALPAGTIPLQENTLNNLLALNVAPSDPIKNLVAQITPDGIRISFQLYGFDSAVAAKPILQNGRLSVSNVAIAGPISLIMSPDELTPLLNKHLSDAQDQIKHPIQSLQLKNQEMDLTLGPAIGV